MVEPLERRSVTQTPIPEDIIGWSLEQAFNSGIIAMRTTFRPEMFDTFGWPSSSTYRYQDPALIVKNAMEDGHQQWVREQHILHIMNDPRNAEVMEKANGRMNEALMKIGIAKEVLDGHKLQKFGICAKAAMLYETVYPVPEEPPRVKFQLVRQRIETTDMREVYLSMTDTLGEILGVLRQFSSIIDGEGNTVSNLATGLWMYQLVDKNLETLSNAPRVYLISDPDYQDLIQQVRGDSAKAASAVFFQESVIAFQKKLLDNSHNDRHDVLEDDGTPYFQEVDWEKFIQKELLGPRKPLRATPRKRVGAAPTVLRRSARLNVLPGEQG